MSKQQPNVTDAEALEWANGLDENSKIELRRRALERAIELLQPKAGPTDKEIASMDDQTFARFKRSLGIG